MTTSPACLLFLLFATADQNAERYPRADLLIEADELIKTPPVRGPLFLDARSKAKYDEGHIAPATWVDTDAWSKAFDNGRDEKAWIQRFFAPGLTMDFPVVVYGEGISPDAARVWWILRYWGFKDVRLLNGGWRAWKAAGGEIRKNGNGGRIAFKPMEKLDPQAARLATKEQVRQSLPLKEFQIIDTRSKDEYCGTEKRAKRGGAIPGAIHLEWVEVIDKDSQRLKKPEELARLLQDKGIDLKRPVVTYCQSGGRAAVMAFTLELMGAKEVRNYYKSWSEWGNATDTPIEKPKP
jgi:thiosulfate/3-mercaptopyruvate sulfurtransferase